MHKGNNFAMMRWIMIIQRKSKTEWISGLLNGKNFFISLMVATFFMFASGSGIIGDSEKILSILIGAGLFTFAAAMLIWAKDISKNLYR